MAFCEATETPVLDFWWHLLWVSRPEWAALFILGRGIYDVIMYDVIDKYIFIKYYPLKYLYSIFICLHWTQYMYVMFGVYIGLHGT